MSDNIIKQTGSFSSSQDSTGNPVLFPSAIKGIVKNNIDDSRTGKIEVYIERKGANPDPEDTKGWITVRYMSPFFGYTPNTGGKTDNGTYVANPNSYGMWMTPPDIGTEVICVFLNGDPSFGFYIGALPKPGINHMVPALGSSDQVITNAGEAKSYGGATRLPVSEINNANPKLGQNVVLSEQARPVHSSQAAILFNQGLLRDKDRGTISSSSMRESPSRVFGISTPGRPIYQGGYTDSTIKDAIKDDTIPNDNFKVIGRTGGHSFVMDDGDVIGADQLVRIRTAQGHMIMMNDAAQTLFIIHANGQSYIELGKEGTIDMYSTNSVNIRTQGDLNLHADRNINLHAGKDGTGDVNIHAENIRTESNKETSQFVGTTFKGYTKGEYTQKNESKTSILSGGEYGVKSKNSVAVLDGTNVKLNSGDPTLTPQEVKQLPIVVHPDTLRDDTKGWAPAPGILASITSRAPAHSPWSNANYGVDIKTDNSASSNLPAAPSAATTATNNSTSIPPANTTSPSLSATTPTTPPVSASITAPMTKAGLSQIAINVANGPAADAVAAGAGVVNINGKVTAVLGAYGAQPEHLEDSGHLIPGAADIANKILASDPTKTIPEALPASSWTGKDGIKSAQDFINDPTTQAKALVSNMSNAENSLKSIGAISGALSGTQTLGLVSLAATQGTQVAANLMNSLSSGLSGAIPIAGNLPSTSAITGAVASLGGSAKDIVAGGNFAAGLADKGMSALGGITVGGFDPSSALKGLSAGLFSTVLKDFEDLTAGSPLNLTQIKAAKDIAKSATDSASSAISGLTSGNGLSVSSLTSAASSIPGLSAFAGGASSITNIVSKVTSFNPSSIPGVGSIASTANTLKSAISGGLGQLSGAVDAVKSELSSSSLESFAKSGLSGADAEKLSASVTSLGGGAVETALATAASATSSQLPTSALKGLAGDDRIPTPDFSGTNPGDTPPDTAAIASVNDLSSQLDAEQANYDTLKTAFENAQDQYGVGSAEANAAMATYVASAQKINDLTNQLSSTTLIV